MSVNYAVARPELIYVNEQQDAAYLDTVLERLLDGDVRGGMTQLGIHLYDAYTSTGSSEWESLVQNVLLKHSIRNTLIQDPHTARAIRQPRGYAGDAATLDLVYFPEKVDLSNTSALGKKIFGFNSQVSIAKALRKRISSIANIIDQTASNIPNARVLSVACGHCREVEYSQAIQSSALGTFIGIDQDTKSIGLAQTEYHQYGIQTEHLNISDLIRGKADLGEFDLIYSAGLYDYLGMRTAQRLTRELFSRLSKGGKLVFYNISNDYPEIGYFESYMNWPMLGRNQAQMREVASKLPVSELGSVDIGDEEKSTYYYSIEITKI